MTPSLWRIDRSDSQSVPLIVNVPHSGTYLPPSIGQTLSAAGLKVPDTDWHVEKLYDFVPSLGATLMVATHSRIVVDLNRDPSGDALYPGASNTEICPTATFANEPIYRPGLAPGGAEIAQRVAQYWRPYHYQLAMEIERIKSRHGICILLDAHSIVSEAPRFFDGYLPDLNLGTADEKSCDESLAQSAFAVLKHAEGFTAVHNGRFKGGFITRDYGVPGDEIHALQLEVGQRCYMDESAPHFYDASRAAPLKAVLIALVEKLMYLR